MVVFEFKCYAFNLLPPVSDSVISLVSLTANASIVDAGSSVVLSCSVLLNVPAEELVGALVSYDYGFTVRNQTLTAHSQMDSALVTNITSAIMYLCAVTLIANSTSSTRVQCSAKSDTEVIALQCKYITVIGSKSVAKTDNCG